MKRFYFGLQKVLKYQTFLERKAQEKLMRTINEHKMKEFSIKAMVSKRNKFADTCSMEKKFGIDVTRYRQYQSIFQKIDADMESAERALKKTEADIQLNRENLLEETVRKKMLEKLREKRKKQYVVACEKEDQKSLDELAINTRELNL